MRLKANIIKEIDEHLTIRQSKIRRGLGWKGLIDHLYPCIFFTLLYLLSVVKDLEKKVIKNYYMWQHS